MTLQSITCPYGAKRPRRSPSPIECGKYATYLFWKPTEAEQAKKGKARTQGAQTRAGGRVLTLRCRQSGPSQEQRTRKSHEAG